MMTHCQMPNYGSSTIVLDNSSVSNSSFKGYHVITNKVSQISLPILKTVSQIFPLNSAWEYSKIINLIQIRSLNLEYLKRNIGTREAIAYLNAGNNIEKESIKKRHCEASSQLEQTLSKLSKIQDRVTDYENRIKDLEKSQGKYNQELGFWGDCDKIKHALNDQWLIIVDMTEKLNALSPISQRGEHLEKIINAKNTTIRDFFNCPETKEPLRSPVIVAIKNKTYFFNAVFFGLYFKDSKFIKDPKAIVSQEAKEFLEKGPSLRTDFVTTQIVEKIFSIKDEILNSEKINLEDYFVEDPTTLEVMQEPMTLACGHSLSKETVTKLIKKHNNIPCPLCRTISSEASVVPNTLLATFIQTVTQKEEGIKEWNEKILPIWPQIQKLKEKLAFDQKTHKILKILLDIAVDYEQNKKLLIEESQKIQILTKEVEDKIVQIKQCELAMLRMDKEDEQFLKDFENHVPEVVEQVERTKKELIQKGDKGLEILRKSENTIKMSLDINNLNSVNHMFAA